MKFISLLLILFTLIKYLLPKRLHKKELNFFKNKSNVKRCNHIKPKNFKSTYIKPNNSFRKSNEIDEFKKFRIHFDYTYTLPHEQLILKEIIIPPVKNFLESALQVRRSGGKLHLYDYCLEIPVPKYLIEEGVSADLVILITTKKGLERISPFTSKRFKNSFKQENRNSTNSSDNNTQIPVPSPRDPIIENLVNLYHKLNNNTINPINKYLKSKYIDNKINDLVTKLTSYLTSDTIKFDNYDNNSENEELSNIVGWASHCMQDEYSLRPIAGLMQYVADLTINSANLEETIWTSMHEFTHILGFDFSMFKDFVDENLKRKPLNQTIILKSKLKGLEELISQGNNLFSKNFIESKIIFKSINSNEIINKKGKDENGVDNTHILINTDANKTSIVIIGNGNDTNSTIDISNKTVLLNISNTTNVEILNLKKNQNQQVTMDLQVDSEYSTINFSEFDINALQNLITNLGENTKLFIKSKKVVSKAKIHYGCDNLEGVELEHYGSVGTAFSHWSKRYMNEDYMIGDTNGEYKISSITLAFLEDTGWYKVDYSKAEKMMWGKNKGCKFLEGKCLQGELLKSKPVVDENFDEFCDMSNDQKCSSGRNFRGLCGVTKYSKNLPKQFQYFQNGENIGGLSELGDFCPFPVILINAATGSGVGSCSSGVLLNSEAGEKICQNCKCLMSSLIDENTVVDKSKIKGLMNYKKESSKAICYDIRCSADTIIVNINGSEVECPLNGGLLSVKGFLGYIECPLFDEVCDKPDSYPSITLSKNVKDRVSFYLENFLSYIDLVPFFDGKDLISKLKPNKSNKISGNFKAKIIKKPNKLLLKSKTNEFPKEVKKVK